jgi:muramoyltetrapeptide carboxypeptidase
MKNFPKILKPGDTIGIVSTSSPTTKEAVQKMSATFAALGYRVKTGEHVFDSVGFMAGLPETRVFDFNKMLRDCDIRMIMTATGGKSALHMLPFIDYEAIMNDPKIFVGLSDPSIILNAITSKTGVPTFHGPNGYNFGHTEITDFSSRNFWPIVTGKLLVPHTFPVENVIRVLREGPNVEGVLFGGHLGTNIALLGTPWAPSWKDAILFVEEIFVELNQIDAMFGHLRLAGVLSSIAGLVIGQFVDCEEKSYPKQETLEDVVLRNCDGYQFPIISNVPLGHTEDKLTLPIGCRVRVSTTTPSLTLLEMPTVE